MTYRASQFVTVKIKDEELQVVDYYTSAVVLELAKGDEITFDGFEDISNWWLDPSFFDTSGATPKFRAIDGNYKITANFAMEYFIVEATDANGNTARLNADGTGAIWVIGTDIGKPSWSMNEVGWNDGKAR